MASDLTLKAGVVLCVLGALLSVGGAVTIGMGVDHLEEARAESAAARAVVARAGATVEKCAGQVQTMMAAMVGPWWVPTVVREAPIDIPLLGIGGP